MTAEQHRRLASRGVRRPAQAAEPLRPRVGELALDTATGRVGILRAVNEWEDPATYVRRRQEASAYGPPKGVLTAWLHPVKGGCEWTTDPKNVVYPPEE